MLRPKSQWTKQPFPSTQRAQYFRKVSASHLYISSDWVYNIDVPVCNYPDPKGGIPVKLTFLGATHEVTGSCTVLEINGRFGLVDCGMEQGKDMFENQVLPVSAAALDFVLLTHAHIDHSGLIPMLFKNGYRGPVYATEETCNLSNIMLRDSAHIQEQEAQWKNRKAARSGEAPIEPIYTLADAEAALRAFRPCRMGQRVSIAEGLDIRFVNAGHLLGSASIEVWFTEGETTRKVVFSGDLGNENMPILGEKTFIQDADYVIIESTYGDRLHQGTGDYAGYLADCIQRTLDRGGNVVIPSFAVGRTQEMLYLIREIKERNMVHGHDGFKVYIDSPLAIEATSVFIQCTEDSLDEETRGLLRRGINPLVFPGLNAAVTSEESKAINFDREPKVIISASGMCEAGRIRHHLKHNLWREESTILFVGYQAEGTLGRTLLDGRAKSVKLFGEEVSVNAEVGFMPGKSGHADQRQLLQWLEHFAEKPRQVFVNHGEGPVTEAFAALVQEQLGITASAPFSGTVFNLATDAFEAEPAGVPIVKKSARTARKNELYDKLVAAGKRLTAIIANSRGLSNKNITKLINQIHQLCDKWQ